MDKNQARGILLAADLAARAAVKANAHRENRFALDCGFAWVVIKDGRSMVAKVASEAKSGQPGHGYKHHKRGFVVYMPGREEHNGQSVAIFQAGAQAFAEVLKAAGIECFADYRLD